MDEMEKKEIEIVTGDGSDLNISDVGEHLTSMRPKSKEKKDIVIPEVKKPDESENEENTED